MRHRPIYPHPVHLFICFLVSLDFRVRGEVVLVVKLNGADNSKSVCQDTGLESITKVTIKVLLLDLRICRSMCWHRTISSFIRIIGIQTFGFGPGLELPDLLVGILGIVLCDIGLFLDNSILP